MKRILIVLMICLLSTLKLSAKTERVTIDGSQGKIAAIIQTPVLKAGEKCPMVIIMHGFSGNKNEPLHTALANRLEKAGIASIRFDFNGHGDSEGEFQDMTVPNEISDAQMVYNYVRSLDYVGDIALTGHSQGGVVASMLAGDLGADKLSAVVLFAPAAVLREDAIRGNTMGATYNPLDPPDYVTLFNGLKLGGNYIKSAFNLPIFETAANYKGPALLIHGTGDRVVPYTYSLLYHTLWKNSELLILEGYDHIFSGYTDNVADFALNYLIDQLKD